MGVRAQAIPTTPVQISPPPFRPTNYQQATAIGMIMHKVLSTGTIIMNFFVYGKIQDSDVLILAVMLIGRRKLNTLMKIDRKH